MELRLDHLIIRTASPAETLAGLAAKTGAPVLAPVEQVGGIASGIVRAGALDIEVLSIGDEPPPRPHGYGLGFVADVPLRDAVAELRASGLATSPAPRVTVGEGGGRRSWRAAQVHGLLPDPFPAPASTRRPGPADTALEGVAGLMVRIPAVARAATRRAGRSMVVLTEYGFDVAGWRATAAGGPQVTAVHLGTAGHRAAWEHLPIAADVPLHLAGDGLGITRVELARPAGETRDDFEIGDVAFAFVS